ncbi:MAG: YceI family protein [Xanthomonadales bacterium]|jgi:polyisoprenoid-binding protein YceI|nr:YceI family protein [Xanthomonadales bacterium]
MRCADRGLAPRVPHHRLATLLSGVLGMLASLQAPAQTALPRYAADPVHSTVVFAVDHMGYSQSIGRFRVREMDLRFDPERWAESRVEAVIDIASLDLADAGWNRTMLGRRWFRAEDFAEARFRSTRVTPTGENRAEIEGELTLLGVTQPVTLQARLNRIGNNLYAGGRRWIGFSATATLSRRAFGMDADPKVVGDTVELRIEIEGPRLSRPARPGQR